MKFLADVLELLHAEKRKDRHIDTAKLVGTILQLFIFNPAKAVWQSPIIARIITCRRLRWAGHVAMMEMLRDTYTGLVGRSLRYAPLGRPTRRRNSSVKRGCEGRRWREPT
jgi:hypothetical protein